RFSARPGPAACVLVALAACRPADRLDARRLRGGLLFVPVAFTLIALGVLGYDHYQRPHQVALWLATAAIAAAVVRFALTFRENLRTPAGERVRSRHRCPDRPRQPARAARRPRPRRRRSDTRAPRPARALRPRRLQVLQRQLRSPG